MIKIFFLILFSVFFFACSDLNVNDIKCTEDANCLSDAVCEKEVCVLKTDLAICSNSNPCDFDFICDSKIGRCRDNSCIGNEDCDANNDEICNDEKICEKMQKCETDMDCKDLLKPVCSEEKFCIPAKENCNPSCKINEVCVRDLEGAPNTYKCDCTEGFIPDNNGNCIEDIIVPCNINDQKCNGNILEICNNSKIWVPTNCLSNGKICLSEGDIAECACPVGYHWDSNIDKCLPNSNCIEANKGSRRCSHGNSKIEECVEVDSNKYDWLVVNNCSDSCFYEEGNPSCSEIPCTIGNETCSFNKNLVLICDPNRDWIIRQSCEVTGTCLMSDDKIICPEEIPISWDDITNGGYFTCVIKSGKLYCWGINNDGELGIGDTRSTQHQNCTMGNYSYCNKPIQVGTDSTWSSISAGQYSACGINNGEIYCWGKLGNEPTNFQLNKIGADSNWVKVSHSSSHTCAINSNSEAYCWGNNFYGQLGIGNNDNNTTPTIVSGTYRWNDISVGDTHTCGVTDMNRLYCWGNDGVGQLGMGVTGQHQNIPTRVGGETWKSVSLGEDYTCGIKYNDKLYCWGKNTYYKFGINVGFVDAILNEPFSVGGDYSYLPYLNFYSKANHTCAIINDGDLYCWGDNNSFQLGIGESTNSSDCVLDEFFMGYCFNPIKVSQIEGLWSKVTTGGRSTCGVSNNKLYCWGNNQYGQLGLGIGISESKLPTLVTIP